MNVEELRRYSAEEILGWEVRGVNYQAPGETGTFAAYQPPGDAPFIETGHWKPDQYRDQLWLVLEKASLLLVAHNDIYVACMKQPAKALEAICKAHRERNETK